MGVEHAGQEGILEVCGKKVVVCFGIVPFNFYGLIFALRLNLLV